MVRYRSRLAALCLAPVASSSSMPLAGFMQSMFSLDGADAEGYEEENLTVGADDIGSDSHMTIRRDFLLDDALYSVFNTIATAQFDILQEKGLDSACWRQAAVSIDADCETMAHARKQRLAVQLSNCHLQDSGRKPIECTPRDSDESCVKKLGDDNAAFQSYTTFFHHVNAICHHLRHTVWQEQTEGLVRGLTASSLATFDRAEQSLEKQEQVLKGQELASAQSQGIADGLSETSTRLAGLSDSLSQELVSAMREIEKQETLLASLLTRQDVAATQASSLSTELNNAKSDLASYMEAIEEDRRYLILAANLCWVLTTAPPLRSARTALFALVAFGLLLEKSLCGGDDRGGLDGLERVDWLVSGLKWASPGTFAAATWAKVFTQEKIRWLTFQAGAVILSHTLTSYYLPSLELGRLASSLLAAWKNSRNGDSRNDDHRVGRGRGDRDDGTAARSGHDHSRHHAGESFQHDGNQDDTTNDDGSVQDDNSNSGRLGAREPVTPGPGRAGNGSSNGGSRRASGQGNTRADGLDGLKRQELQSLAKKTDGVVRANLSTLNIIRGLRELGITEDALDH
ncbi:conserved unknown protein [Ectocarpus siliculosus]|uniref:Uncharacterized protein n=1 Tax=Ectocarpus siliculosus TaxID=2880 RepID=D8LGF6_ECTSI|nr:conserved unknown protein [Ectocarpus siliculosus]|eukprot:CBN75731.1 conserved unknown protein [Ectocarpus siliculosus]